MYISTKICYFSLQIDTLYHILHRLLFSSPLHIIFFFFTQVFLFYKSKFETHGGHLHQQQFTSDQQLHNIPGIFSQVNHMSDGMYTSLAQPCEGKNINTNARNKLFEQWSLVQQIDWLMVQDQHQFKSHQDMNIDTTKKRPKRDLEKDTSKIAL